MQVLLNHNDFLNLYQFVLNYYNDLFDLRHYLTISYLNPTVTEHNHDVLLKQNILDQFISNYFQSNYILNSFGAFINSPKDKAYVSHIHRDVRTYIKEARFLLNMLIMLDDFTLENGATYILPGSHHCK